MVRAFSVKITHRGKRFRRKYAQSSGFCEHAVYYDSKWAMVAPESPINTRSRRLFGTVLQPVTSSIDSLYPKLIVDIDIDLDQLVLQIFGIQVSQRFLAVRTL
jgi:hypothetical protein